MPLTSSITRLSVDEGSTNEEGPQGLSQGATEEQISPSREKSKERIKSKGRRGTKMSSRSTFQVEVLIYRNIVMHTLAAEHFRFRNFWFFEVQTGLCTMFSSLLAFLATTELYDERSKITITTIVGTTSIFVGFLQSMSSLARYESRALQHDTVAMDLREHRNNLRMMRYKLGFIENSPGTVAGLQHYADEEDDTEEYEEGTFESIKDRYQQTLSGCKSPLPIQISEAFNGFESSLSTTMVQSAHERFASQYGPEFSYEPMFLKQYDVVAGKIMSYPLFPAKLPYPDRTIKKSLEVYRKTFKEGWEYFNDV